MASFTSKASGNYSAVGQTTWNEVGFPAAGDTIIINNTHTVALDGANVCEWMGIVAGGTLNPGNVGHSLECQGDFNPTAGTITNGKTNDWALILSGADATWTTGTNSDDYRDVTISANCTLAGATFTYIWNSFTLNATLSGTKSLILTDTAVSGFTSTGTLNIDKIYLGLETLAARTTSGTHGTITTDMYWFVQAALGGAGVVSLGGDLVTSKSCHIYSNGGAGDNCTLALNGNDLSCGNFDLDDAEARLAPGNTGQSLKCNGDVDTSAGIITNGGTDSWTLRQIGASRTLNMGTNAAYNLDIGDGSTTTSVTAVSAITADGFTVQNSATWSFSTYTVTVTSFWFADATAIVNYDTGEVNLTGTGARTKEFKIDGTNAKEYYILDIDDDYSIAGDIETVIVDGTQNGLQIASGKTLTLEKHIELMDRQIQNTLCSGASVVTGVGLGQYRMILEVTTSQSMNSVNKPTLSSCNVVFKLASGYTGGVDGRIIFSGASTYDSVDITSDHVTYDCEVETIAVAFVCNGICTVEAKGILLNNTTDADWTFNENLNVSGTLDLDISAMAGSEHISMAAGKSINFLSGSTILINGTGGTDAVISWAGAGTNFMYLTGGTITIDYLSMATNISGVLINGNCTLDADFWDITGTAGGLGITSDFTLTKMSDCTLTSAAINALYVGSLVTGDYDFTNITFAGAHTNEIEHDGTGFLQFFDAVGLSPITDGVTIDNASGGVVNDSDITSNTVYGWGVFSLSDCTNVGSWANDIDIAALDNVNASYLTNITWDVILEFDAGATTSNATFTIVDGASLRYRNVVTAFSNNGTVVVNLGAAESATIYAAAGTGVWGTNALTFSSTCEGTLYLGTAALEGMDLDANNLDLDIDGGGVIVELVGTNAFHTITVETGDTLQSPNNGGVNTQSSSNIIVRGTFVYGKGTITNDHTWTMANGAYISIDGGTFNAIGQSLTPTNGVVNIDWAIGNGGYITSAGTLVWDYVDCDYVEYIEMATGGNFTIDNSDILSDTGATYGIRAISTNTLSMDNTIVATPDYALYWTANNVDCTGTIQNCALAGTTRDIYFDSPDGILQILDSDDGAAGALTIEVPNGGFVDDQSITGSVIRCYGTVVVSDLTGYGSWTIGDDFQLWADTPATTNADVTIDVDCSINRVVTQVSQVVSVSATVTTLSGATTNNNGTFRCLDGMIYGPTSGQHIWRYTAPNIGYDSANSPTIQFRNMDFATNSIPISTTNEDVILQTSGNIAWYNLTVKEGDEWHHLDNNTTITWTGGQTSTIEAGTTTTDGQMKVYGTSGSHVVWTTTGTDHIINCLGGFDIKFVTVDHSDASGGKQITALDSTDGNDNTNWWFTGDTQWQGMSPEIFKLSATELTPTIIGDVMFSLGLKIYEHRTLRAQKPTVDQNWIEVRGRNNIKFSAHCLDLTSGTTDLDQFEEWWRNASTIQVLCRYTGNELQFYDYQPAGWRITRIERERKVGTDRVEYVLYIEEVP